MTAEEALEAGTDAPKLEIDRLELVRASDVQVEPIRWLWPGYLAKGKLQILAGTPGTGKTTIAMDFAAAVSRGARWPDKTLCEDPGKVFIWSGEDSPSDTLVPRLRAAGANLENIWFGNTVQRAEGGKVPFDPASDMPLLRARLNESGEVRLLILDPIVSAVAGDSHKNTEVRRDLQPIVDLAQELDIAVLGITHLSKGSEGRNPLDRVTGSLAFGAVARVVLVAAKNERQEGGSSRSLVRVKSNIGPDGGGFGYDLLQEPLADYLAVETSRVSWGEVLEGSARSILAEAEESGGESGDVGALGEAVEFLRLELADGPLSPGDIQKRSRDAGISSSTLRRAREGLGISPGKPKIEGIRYAWSWPSVVPSRFDVDHLAQTPESGQDGQDLGNRTPPDFSGQFPGNDVDQDQRKEARP